MKIRVNGCMSLSEYANTSDRFEELKLAVENVQFHDYDAFDNLLYSPEVYGMEGIVTDMITTTYKATTGSVKAGVKGYQAVNRGWGAIKNKWAKIKPMLIKMIKNFGIALSNLWHKFLEYDKKYKELGQKINNIIQFSVNQMQTMPSVSFYYHEFNAVLLKGVIDVIANWGFFYQVVTEGFKNKKSNLFPNEFPSPEKVAESIKNNDLNRLQNLVQDFSTGIGKLNQDGEITIGNVLNNIFKWGIENRLPKDIRKASRKNDVGLSDYIKHAILGEQIKKNYSNENKNEFVSDMIGGNGAYLNLVASILNNNILEDALKKGGVSTKKGTDSLVRSMEAVMKQAEVTAKIEEDKEKRTQAENEKREKAMQRDMDKNNNDETMTTVERAVNDNQNFGNSDNMDNINKNGVGNTENQGQDNTISGLAELYCKNYVIFVTKLSNTYGNLVRGILAATYEIVSETQSIVDTIEASATRTK